MKGLSLVRELIELLNLLQISQALLNPASVYIQADVKVSSLDCSWYILLAAPVRCVSRDPAARLLADI